MKVLIAQTNPIPSDWIGNLAQIQDGIAMASNQEAQLAIFPELSVPGYLCQDKMYEPDFVFNNLRALQEVAEFSRAVGPAKPFIVVGYIDRNHVGCGKPFRNMAAVIRDGVLIGTYQKRLLPYYDVFDEGRYFASGRDLFVFDCQGTRWGVVICEDWWNDKGQDDYNHADNPMEEYRKLGVKNIISINYSPYGMGKSERRIKQAKEVASGGIFIFVNQRGGTDELVADGGSFVVNSGSLQYLCSATDTPHYEIFDLEQNKHRYMTDEREPWDVAKDILTLGIRDYTRKNGFKSVLLGSSGGVDSALVLTGACDALGPENVVGVRMPSIYSSDHSKTDAELLHKNLGCHDLVIPVEHMPMLNHINQCTKSAPCFRGLTYNPIADQNLQARLRANDLLHLSNAWGLLLLTTGNKTEATFGYCTLGGDMMGGFAPIKDLYKYQVYRLIMAMSKGRVPNNIVDKKPSAELAPDQFDENDLQPYPILDAIALAYCEYAITTYTQFHMWLMRQRTQPVNHWEREEWEKARKAAGVEIHDMVYAWAREHPRDEYARLALLAERNEYKRRLAAPGIKFHRVAYGSGRRIPIVKR